MVVNKGKKETKTVKTKENVKEVKKVKSEKKGIFGKIKKEKIVAPQDAKPVADPFEVIRFVLMTEKSIRMVELQNKLVFIVTRSAKKPQIKSAVQDAFGSPVSNITTMVDQSGRKKAFVKFKTAGAAGDIAIKLGVI